MEEINNCEICGFKDDQMHHSLMCIGNKENSDPICISVTVCTRCKYITMGKKDRYPKLDIDNFNQKVADLAKRKIEEDRLVMEQLKKQNNIDENSKDNKFEYSQPKSPTEKEGP